MSLCKKSPLTTPSLPGGSAHVAVQEIAADHSQPTRLFGPCLSAFLGNAKKNIRTSNPKKQKIMRTSLLLCVSYALISTQVTAVTTAAHHHHTTVPRSIRHLLHAETVASVRLSPLPGPEAAPGHHVGVRRLLHEVDDESHADLHAPFGRRLALHFQAFGKNHSVVLNLHDALFEEGGMSRYTDDQGKEVVEIPHAVAYTGTFPDGGWIRATIYDDDVIRAMWLDKSRGVVNMLTPVSYYEAMAPSVAASALAAGGKMLAFRLNDMDHADEDRLLLESRRHGNRRRRYGNRRRRHGRRRRVCVARRFGMKRRYGYGMQGRHGWRRRRGARQRRRTRFGR